MSSDQNMPMIPEGCILVKKSDIEQIKDLVKEIESSARPNHSSIDDLLYQKSYLNTLNKDDLVSKFTSTCQNSTLQSKIETVKSTCTNKLKTTMKDIATRRNESKKELKQRFEKGSDEIRRKYQDQLMLSFRNQSTLNNSLPVEQYACEELVKSYRECLEKQLLPEMDKMYKSHCKKMDTALKTWVQQYNAVTLNGTQMSPAVNERIHAIQDRLNRMCVNSQNRAFERKIEETIQKVTNDIGLLTVEATQEQRAPSNQELVDESLERGDYQDALHKALVAIDLDLLMSTCERMSVEDVFGETSPVQPDILALLNQLSHNLAKNVAVTSNYLMEAVQALDLTDVVISSNRETVNKVLSDLIKHIDSAKQLITPREFNTNLKQLRWATQQIIRQLESSF